VTFGSVAKRLMCKIALNLTDTAHKRTE